MKTIILIMLLTFGFAGAGSLPKLDFGEEKGGQDWRALNDGVMGGLSRSAIEFTANSLRFSGEVSLANNGGFASLRSTFGARDLSDYESLTVRLRATGQTFAFVLETSSRWFDPNFKYVLRPEKVGEWETFTIPLADFKAYRVGRRMNRSMSPEDQAQVIRLGFITDDKQAGSFELEVDYLAFQ